jgi:hypothetical protein
MPPISQRHYGTCLALAVVVCGLIWLVDPRGRPVDAGGRAGPGPDASRADSRAAVAAPPVAVGARRAANDGRDASGPPAMVLKEDFMRQILSADHATVSIPLPGGGQLRGSVTRVEFAGGDPLLIEGVIGHPAPGRYHFRRQQLPGMAGPLFGFVLFDQGDTAWRVRPPDDHSDVPMLVRTTAHEVICRSYAAPPAEIPAAHPVDDPIPPWENDVIQLQSLPGAGAVVYLDFDGEERNFEVWGHVNAAPSGATNPQIFDVWQGICEDFQPFRINITTIRSVFDAALPNQRMQVIVTPTDTVAPGAGGVAIIGSFNTDGDVVCWAFQTTGKHAIEAISHEIGHALGLSHDGRVSPPEEYYGGVSGGDWAPIMGIGFHKPLTQWSKGEYPGASNLQDDLTIISSNNNGVAYRGDDHGPGPSTASWLDVARDGDAYAEGIIETQSDRDSFRFSTSGGALSIQVNPVPPVAGVPIANLDIKAELLRVTSSLTSIIATSDPADSLGAWFGIPELAAGDYLIRISGTGKGNLLTGYSDYASIGSYTITGNVGGGVHAERFFLAENSPAGTVVGTVMPRANHSSGVLDYAIVRDSSGGTFQIHPATGSITVANDALLDYEALSSRWDDPAILDFLVTIGDTLDFAIETIRVAVVVTDVNEPPVFEPPVAAIMPARVAPGTAVTRVRASDPDRGDSVTFSIPAGNDGGLFAIDPATGEITVATAPDEQSPPVHVLTIRATDRADPPGVTDSPLTIDTLPVPAGITAGSLVRTYYDKIPGTNVADLTGSPRFPERPDRQFMLGSFHAGTGTDDESGSVISGYVIAPASGSYVFWISACESAELRLSPGMQPENALAIAAVAGSSRPGEWNKEPGQQSTPVDLQAGSAYYIEARHKQGQGMGHVQVAWQRSGMTAREIIPGLWLAPDARNFAPWAESAIFTVRDGAAGGTVVGRVPFIEPNSGQMVAGYAITGGNDGGCFTIGAEDGVIRVNYGAHIAPGGIHQLTITATDNGDPAATGSAMADVTVCRLDENLFAWWQLDETAGSLAVDSSGNRRDAWLVGNATRVPRDAADNALQLDGADAGLSHYSMDSPAGVTPFTVAAWLRVPPDHDHEAVIIQQAADPVLTGPGLFRVSVTADGGVRFLVYGHNASMSDVTYQFDLVADGGIDDGNWHHIACVRDGETGRIFIDGIECASGSGTPRLLEAGSALSVGYDEISFNAHLRATVDDIRIYQDALAAAQIARIAAAPKLALTRSSSDAALVIPEGVGLLLETAASSPSGHPPNVSWSLASGPAGVVFDNPGAAATGVSFPTVGHHVLKATASNGSDDVSLELSVIVGCTAVTRFSGNMVGSSGSGSHAGIGPGSYLLSADSSGIHEGGTNDGFYLLGQAFSGDFDIRARVDGSYDNSHGEPLGIAGLIVRTGQSGADDSASGLIGIRPAEGSVALIRRFSSGGSNTVADFPGITVPHWCRITRSGTEVEFYHSTDGTAWTRLGSMNLSGMVNAGLCWTSNQTGQPGSAQFSGVEGFANHNVGPAVNAEVDFSTATGITVRMGASFTDDGLPDPPAAVTLEWRVVSAPGPVYFADQSDALTAVTFGAAGDYLLRLVADDGAVATFDEVAVTVSDAALSAFEIWQIANFGGNSNDPLVAGELADPDGDGLPNLLEYALGTKPMLPGPSGISQDMVEYNGGLFLRLTIPRDPDASDVTITGETTSDLSNPASWTDLHHVIETDEPSLLVLRDALGGPRRFMRLRAER